MAGRTVNIKEFIKAESLAVQIADLYTVWSQARAPWLAEKKELRNYIFQTSTRDTTNSKLPWKNSTATPKICQIRDNLHANYMAALFPNENWLTWEGGDKDAEMAEKRLAIEAYMKNKTEASQFRATVSQLVYDWIDYGNAFATTEFVKSIHKTDEDEIVQYVGPKLVRISPEDIVFNPIVSAFEDSPKIVRSIKTLGDIKKDVEDRPEMQYQEGIFNKMMETRKSVASLGQADVNKNDGFVVDGFGSYNQYFQSGMVEILELYGDIFDPISREIFSNHIVTIFDRAFVARKVPIPGWNINKIRQVGWRLRPDNLYAMGPLDNLVGMQYRIDHLENLKADVFDLIAHPVMKIKGYVEDFEYGPGARIVIGEDGDVAFLPPDATALNADTQIHLLEQKMEEFAGAPKQAMGIRTPGEKTALEVQTLENSAGRIFQNKTTYFEQVFLEHLLNDMLEVARRNITGSDLLRVLNDQIDVVVFKAITKEDIQAKGKLKPIGARHFATKANMLQNFLGIANSAIGQDPAVAAHISGKKIAQMIEELLSIKKFGLVSDNIRILEQMDTQRLVNQGQEQLQVEQATPAGVTADEMVEA